jgi:hypothetical protein
MHQPVPVERDVVGEIDRDAASFDVGSLLTVTNERLEQQVARGTRGATGVS